MGTSREQPEAPIPVPSWGTAGLWGDARAGTCPQSRLRRVSEGRCSGFSVPGAAGVGTLGKASGEIQNLPPSPPSPAALTEGREASEEGEIRGFPGGRDVTEGSPRIPRIPPDPPDPPGHRGCGSTSPAFPDLERSKGRHGHPPASAQLWAQTGGTEPPRAPSPGPAAARAALPRDGAARGAMKASEVLWRKEKEGQREAGKRPCLLP